MSEALRLNKYISETGFCSRREADTLISDGRVTVNGKRAEMGLKVTQNDDVKVDGKPLKAKPKRVYIAYNKPVGVTCTTERKIKSNIVSAINYPERIFPIGRLDRPSEGLIFLTNEGDIVNKILRSGNNHEKEYEVQVDKPLNRRFVERMGAGIPILGTVTKKCKVEQTGLDSFRIILTQGLNRQIRRMCEYLGYEVVKLKRVRIMNVTLTGLKSGQWRHLTEQEMARINASIEGSKKTHDIDEQIEQPAKSATSHKAQTRSQLSGTLRRPPTANGAAKKPAKSRSGHTASAGHAKPAKKMAKKPFQQNTSGAKRK